MKRGAKTNHKTTTKKLKTEEDYWLPQDLWGQILSYIPPTRVTKFATVSQFWSQFINNSYPYGEWQDKYFSNVHGDVYTNHFNDSPLAVFKRILKMSKSFSEISHIRNNVALSALAGELTLIEDEDMSIKDIRSLYCLSLQNAAFNGNLDAVRTLLNRMNGLNYGFISKNKALCSAVQAKHVDIVKLLLEAPDVFLFLWLGNETKNNPFVSAVNSQSHQCLALLLNKADNHDIHKNSFCMIIAASRGDSESIRLFLADKRIVPTMEENKLLRSALAGKHLEVIKLLLADPRVNIDEDTLASLAKTAGYSEVIELLQNNDDSLVSLEIEQPKEQDDNVSINFEVKEEEEPKTLLYQFIASEIHNNNNNDAEEIRSPFFSSDYCRLM